MAQRSIATYFKQLSPVQTPANSDKDSERVTETEQVVDIDQQLTETEQLTETTEQPTEAIEQHPAVATDQQDQECQCPGCLDTLVPNHPADLSGSKVFYKHKDGKSFARKIQPTWYKQFPWVSVCSSSYRIFCMNCRTAKQKLCSHFQGISTTPLLQLVLVIGAELYKCFVVMKRVKAIKKPLLN